MKMVFATALVGSVLAAFTLSGCGSTANDSDSSAVATFDPTDTTPAPDESWQLIWRDEFNAASVDIDKWNLEYNCWGGGNYEQQCYTRRKANVFVDGGWLHIVAKEGNFTGPDNLAGDSRSKATLPFTSARLNSKDKGDFKYGRFEVRAKLPHGQGTWPAIWMLPTDNVYGTWAASGEIDIVEAVNLKTPSDKKYAVSGDLENRVYGSLHFGRQWPDNAKSVQEYELPDDSNPADGFHTYALEWEEGEIRWYVDGKHYATQRQDGWYTQYLQNGQLVTGKGAAPFDQRFHLVLNLAVGGSWSAQTNNQGIDASIFPQTLLIDYVRVYRCTVEPDTGKGCGKVDADALIVKGEQPPALFASPDYAKGPVFKLYDDEMNSEVTLRSYDPEGNITVDYLDDFDRGEVMRVEKSGATGNIYFAGPPVDMSKWVINTDLVFDLRVESNPDDSELLVKIDSGWPYTSDYKVELPAKGEWREIRIKTADLVDGGNRFATGAKVDIMRVTNPFVLEPQGKMSLQLDNVRYEYALMDLPLTFEKPGVNYSFADFGGSETVLTKDPAGERGNVAKTVRYENASSWSGTTAGGERGFGSYMPLTNSNSILSVWVYSPAANIPVLMKVEDSRHGARYAEVMTKTTVANSWEQLVFDFSKADPELRSDWQYNTVSLFFNFGAQRQQDDMTFYWDELKFGK